MAGPRLSEAFVRLQADLRSIEAKWALVGGLAVSGRTEPRTTRDIDVVVAVPDDKAAEAVSWALRNRGYQLDTQLEQTATGRLSTVRFLMPDSKLPILADLLFGSSGIEPEVVEAADMLEIFPQTFAPVAKTGHLLALKVLALRPDRPQERPQDLTDIRELLRVADDEELRRARHALDLISRRGFDRGKDLQAEFEEQLRQFREGQDEGL